MPCGHVRQALDAKSVAVFGLAHGSFEPFH
jgi:hypothetical protein